jgi:hypothetical protein
LRYLCNDGTAPAFTKLACELHDPRDPLIGGEELLESALGGPARRVELVQSEQNVVQHSSIR